MKTVLITGISGYLGSRLAAALRKDHRVFGLVRRPVKTTYLDEELQREISFLPYDGTYDSMLAALKAASPNVVFHLATYYTSEHNGECVTELMQSNVVLGAHLLEAMSTVGCQRLVYATTVTANYLGKGYAPLSLYAATKQAFSDLVEFYTDAELIRAASLMLSDTYGANDQRPKVLNLIRQAILNGKTMELTSGNQPFSLLYVDDVVDAFLCSAEALELEGSAHCVFQPRSMQQYTLRETVELFLQVNQLTVPLNWGAKADPQRQMTTDIRMYPDPPGWQQKIFLCDGLRRFWEERM